MLERVVLKMMVPGLVDDAFLDACRFLPQNSDGSIVDIQLPEAVRAGKNIVELAHGVFKDDSEAVRAFVLLLGDEWGNPRELDFHGLSKGLTIDDLGSFRFIVL